MSDKNMISVFGLVEEEESTDRGLRQRMAELLYARKPVDPDDLKNRLSAFVSSMEEVLTGLPDAVGGLAVDSITIAVEVSAKGTVSLLGTGGELAGKGGITFTLRRPK